MDDVEKKEQLYQCWDEWNHVDIIKIKAYSMAQAAEDAAFRMYHYEDNQQGDYTIHVKDEAGNVGVYTVETRIEFDAFKES